MIIKILAFGISKDIVGSHSISIEAGEDLQVSLLREILNKTYPKLKELKSYMIAINNNYVLPEIFIDENDEVAIIPPVSGG